DGRTTDPAFVLETDARPAALSSFTGLDPNGTWKLFLADLQNGQTATLDSWSMSISEIPEPVNVALVIFGLLVLGGTLTRAAWRARSAARRAEAPATAAAPVIRE